MSNGTGRRRGLSALLACALTLTLAAGCSGPALEVEHSSPDIETPAPEETSVPTALPTPTPTVTPNVAEDGVIVDDLETVALERPEDAPVITAAPRNRAAAYSEEAYEAKVSAVLGGLVREDMTQRQKCRAIYTYVKYHITYTGSSDKSDWKRGAYTGLTTGKGDCYTYYACCRALLTALGIENLEVRRWGSSMPTSHYWNLVNYGEGWYHMDACPHYVTSPAFECFMATDQQLMNYDAGEGKEYYHFDADAYPERVGGRADPDAVVPMPRRKKPEPEPPAETDPATGLPIQTITDPETGEVRRVVIDPVTGEVVPVSDPPSAETDPATGLPIQTITDPETGETRRVVIDPVTGEAVPVSDPPPAETDPATGLPIQTITDPETGETRRVVIDPVTGETVPVSDPPPAETDPAARLPEGGAVSPQEGEDPVESEASGEGVPAEEPVPTPPAEGDAALEQLPPPEPENTPAGEADPEVTPVQEVPHAE